jgi:hypothetical protein
MNAEQSVFWPKTNAVQANFSPASAFLKGIKFTPYAPASPFASATRPTAVVCDNAVSRLHQRPNPKKDVPRLQLYIH